MTATERARDLWGPERCPHTHGDFYRAECIHCTASAIEEAEREARLAALEEAGEALRALGRDVETSPDIGWNHALYEGEKAIRALADEGVAGLRAKVAAMTPDEKIAMSKRLEALIAEVEARPKCDQCGEPSDRDADPASGIILCSECITRTNRKAGER